MSLVDRLETSKPLCRKCGRRHTAYSGTDGAAHAHRDPTTGEQWFHSLCCAFQDSLTKPSSLPDVIPDDGARFPFDTEVMHPCRVGLASGHAQCAESVVIENVRWWCQCPCHD